VLSSEIAGRGEPVEVSRRCAEAGVERMVKMKDILREFDKMRARRGVGSSIRVRKTAFVGSASARRHSKAVISVSDCGPVRVQRAG
jgi:hypothetical protein